MRARPRPIPIALTLIVLAMTAPCGAQTWPNEPFGSVRLAENPFTFLTPAPWFADPVGGFSIVNNQNDPSSPSALQAYYPVGHPGGSGVGNIAFHTSGRNQMYFGAWIKLDQPFQNHPGGTKVFYVTGPNGYGHPYYLLLTGPDPVYGLTLVSQGSHALDNRHIASCTYVATCNLWGGGGITQGTWHRIELYLKQSDTISSKNGIAMWWVDGKLVADHRNLNTDPAYPYGGVHINPVYGGGTGVYKTQPDYMWFGHMVISQPNCSSGCGAPAPPPPSPPPAAPPPAPVASPGTVTNLTASPAGASAINLSFTEVTDGTGRPAKYEVRMASGAAANWPSMSAVSQGTCASPLTGSSIGAQRTCSVTGLDAGTQYQFQLVAFRGTLNLDAVFGQLSNAASATTAAAVATTDLNGDGSTTIVDVQLAINQAMGSSTCGTGDINGDGACNVTDVQRVVNAALEV